MRINLGSRNNPPLALVRLSSDSEYSSISGEGGELYFNTTTNNPRMHNGTDWEDVFISGSTITIGDLQVYSAYVVSEPSYSGTSPEDLTIDASEYYGPPLNFRIRYKNTGLNPDQFDLHTIQANNLESKALADVDLQETPTYYYQGLKLYWGSANGHNNFDSVDFSITEGTITIKSYSGEDLITVCGGGVSTDGYYLGKSPVDPDNFIIINTNVGDKGDNKGAGIILKADGTVEINTVSSTKRIDFKYLSTVRVATIYNNRMGIGVTNPNAKLEVNQSSASLDVPALKVTQADEDKEIISLNGTSAADKTKNISTQTTGFTLVGYVKVEIGGSPFWVPYYS